MANSPDTPPFPTFEEARAQGIFPRCTPAMQLLYWGFNGPLATELFVMKDKYDPDDKEPYFRPAAGSGEQGTWHPIASEPLTRVKISSITVHVYSLARWVEEWLNSHEEACPEQESSVYGRLEDAGGEEPDDEELGWLLECCGEKRPPNIAPLVVRAGGEGYVTVHGYVSAVHEWMVGLREMIMQSERVFDDKAMPEGTRLVVNHNALDRVTVVEEEREKASIRNGRRLEEYFRARGQLCE